MRDGTGESSADGSTHNGDGMSTPDGTSDATPPIDALDTMIAEVADVPVDAPDVANTPDVPDAPDVPICASSETCNGVDDTCNGTIDENIPAITCGVGACRRSVVGCVAGMVPTCAPGVPGIEICNGIDDDCDGMTDNLPMQTCGIGACQSAAPGCSAGLPGVCRPVAPALEACDGIDNDCDGVIDDGCGCDRYVLLGASGTGLTASTPTGLIQAAIMSLAATGSGGRVCVGAPAAVSGSTPCVSTIYAQQVVMAEGVSVFGSYRVNGSVWTRDPLCLPSTFLGFSDATGLFFGHSITNATQLDGFTIGASPAPGILVAATVTIQAGGTVSNNVITAGLAPTSIGIDIGGSPAPAIGPRIARNTISGSGRSSVVESIGIRVRNPAAMIQQNISISGGIGVTGPSTGIKLEGGRGAVITDNQQITGGSTVSSGTTSGIWVSGDATGVVIARNSIQGAGFAGESRGVRAEACSAGTIAMTANTITGGIGTVSSGVWASGCSVSVVGNELVAGRTSGSSTGNARGVFCTGVGTNCNVLANRRIVGLDGTATSNTDGTGVALTLNSTGNVLRNSLVMGCAALSAAATCTGIWVGDTSGIPRIDNNIVEGSRGTIWGTGIRGVRTNAVISGNLVFLDRHDGISLGLQRAVGATEATVINNTVISPPAPAMSPGMPNLIVLDFEGAAAIPPNGIVRNNLAVCLGAGANRTALRESGSAADPRVLENNDLFGCGTLYFDVDTGTSLTMIAAVNALADIPTRSNNLSVDPLFRAPGNYHLSVTSPVIDVGTLAAPAPAQDIDGDPRPLRLGIDIGYDEVP